MSSLEKKKSSVRAQFGRRAGAYASSESHAWDRDLDLLLQHLDLRKTDRVLDVATGTGFTAIALRPRVASVTGVDLTHGMLLEAQRLAASLQIHWVEGDVEALPFRGEAFSVVTCRRAPHHFTDLDQAIDEMLRVLGIGGRIGIIDQVNPEDADGMRLMDELERLRDPSHEHTLSVGEWQAILGRHQIVTTFLEVVESRLSFAHWQHLADTNPQARRMVESALHAATPQARKLIGFLESPEPSFLKRWIVLVGRKQ